MLMNTNLKYNVAKYLFQIALIVVFSDNISCLQELCFILCRFQLGGLQSAPTSLCLGSSVLKGTDQYHTPLMNIVEDSEGVVSSLSGG